METSLEHKVLMSVYTRSKIIFPPKSLIKLVEKQESFVFYMTWLSFTYTAKKRRID